MPSISNSKQYNYIISNFDKYNLELTSETDMLILLNKLEAYDETLDSLHDCNGNMNGFCDLVVTNDNQYFTDAEISNAVNETNAFFESKEQYLEWSAETDIEDLKILSEIWDDNLEGGSIVKTTDGYVELSVI